MSAIIQTVDARSLEEKISVMERFTQTFRQNYDNPLAVREAACLKCQLPARLAPIHEGDVFAGRMNYLPIGFAAQTPYDRFGYYMDAKTILEYMDQGDDSQSKRLRALLDYWETRNTTYLTKQSYPQETARALFSDEWVTESGVAFPLYRMAGALLDYEKLLTLGVPGLKALVQKRMDKASAAGDDCSLFQGMLSAVDVFADCCLFYRDDATKQSLTEKDARRKKELLEIAAALDNISRKAPETFREAIQAVMLYWLISTSLDFGRMDVYLSRFYVNDVDSGRITEAQALDLLKGMWLLMGAGGSVFDTRVVIGGLGRKREDEADRFCLLAMQASLEVKEVMPQLTLRFHKNTAPEIMEKAYSVIGAGRTYPMLYNDDVNVPAVMKAFNLPYDEAVDYCPYGCGEYVIYRRSFGSPNGVINLLKALEVTLHNGFDPVTKRPMGLALGEFSGFKTFDELWQAYTKQVEYYVDALANQEDLEYKAAGSAGAFLFFSLLYDDCIERGKAIFSGGVRYLGGTLESYGNVNAADSLTAIKTLVYDQKRMTQDEMLSALDADFMGFEKERKLMLNAPKFGNDDPCADEMMVKVHEQICLYTQAQKDKADLHSYLVVVINNQANTILGRTTAASADGRKARTYMANANNPSGGSDRNGLTAMLNSLQKPPADIHAGAVQNMKFSKELFTAEMLPKFKAVINTYFENGGTQAMISVLDRNDLENALANPSEYGNLIVRVGGFSARYVELDPDVQQEVLSRVIY